MRNIEQILEDYPSLKLQYEQVNNMLFLKLLMPKEQRKELDRIKKNMSDLIMTTEEYNNNFSDYGWIAYSLINVEFMKKANKLFKDNGIEKAEEFIADYYIENSKNAKRFIQYSSNEFRKRANIINEAFEAYENERYCSAVTLFLTIADGVINDFTKNKGFFTEGVDLDCWDCLVECDKGLKKIKDIYNLPRKKTNEKIIKMPYRNGILHGRDLNYGNKFVSGKCIVMLLAISEWIKNKNTEDKRKEQYIKEANPPALGESLKKLQETEETRKIINNWESREIVVGKDIPITGKKEDYTQYDFIYKFVETLEIWKSKNYGELAKRFEIIFNYEDRAGYKPKRCRELFEKNILLEFKLTNITDQSICMKVIELEVKLQKEDKIVKDIMKIGMVYEGEKDIVAIPNKNNGEWKIYPRDIKILYG